MTDPIKYVRGYSFSNYQSTNPANPLPGPRLDNELANVERAAGGLVDAIKGIRRSGGRLRDGVVTIDSLSPAVKAVLREGLVGGAGEIQAILDDLLLRIPDSTPSFTPLRLWGWAGSNYIVACCDISDQPASAVSLVVATDAGLTNIVSESTPKPTITTPGAGAVVYYTVQQAKVSGLAPNTAYFYGMRVNGEVKDVVNSIRTPPAAGVAASFRIAFGSCSKPASSSRPDRVYRAIAARNPLFLLHLGDMDYSDVDVAAITVQRSRNSRTMRENFYFDLMSSTVPTLHTVSDHDSAGDNNSWGEIYLTGYSAQDVITQTRLAIFETEPLPPLWQAGEPDKTKILLGRTVKVGRVAFIVPDWQSQKRRISTAGQATVFGNGTNPPGSFNQDGRVFSELTAADADAGTKLVVFGVAPTWSGVPFDSLPKFHSIDQTRLCDKFASMDTMVTIQSGDCHQSGLDNGVNTDYSSDGTMRVVQAASSPLSNMDVFDLAGPFLVDGVPAEVENISNQFGEMEVTDNGGSNLSFTYRAYSAPFDPVTFAGALRLTYDSADHLPTLGFEGKTTVIATAQGVPVYKQGCGPIDGAGFSYALTAGGAAGTAKVKPNRNIGFVPLTGLAAGATGVLTLSNPQRSAISGPATVNFVVRSYRPETAMYLNALDVMPDVTRQSVINTYIDALITAGLWDKFGLLHLHASNAASDALVNVRRPRGRRLTVVGTPTFLQDRYNSGTGSATGYFDSGYNGGLGYDMGQGFAFCRVLNNVDRSSAVIGNGTLALNPRSSNLLRFRMMTAETYTVPNTVGSGLFLIDRAGPTDPDGVNVWRDTTLLGHVIAPTFPTNNVISLTTMLAGAWQSLTETQYDNRQLASWGVGRGGWTPQNVSDFKAIDQAYLATVGAV